MLKHKLAFALLALVLGFAAAPNAFAAGPASPNAPLSTPDSDVSMARFCPISIFCIKGRVPKCHYVPAKHRCVCRCVPRHPY
ncbi:MAG TPA: hypothetical protein VEM36_11935 [Xanthobacteraceae bacterium]|nr:hypothetical protein [Xanthobacteraceae bacterium]